MTRKKPIGLFVVLLIVAGLVAWIAVSTHRENVRSETYARAWSLCRDGQYAEAAELYEQLGDYKRSKALFADCSAMVAVESARAEALSLKESGKLEEAQECLREYRYIDISDDDIRECARESVDTLYAEIVEARAAEMADQGNAAEAVQMLRDENVGDSHLCLVYDQIADEQAFRAALKAGDMEAARKSLDAIRHYRSYVDRLTIEDIDAMEAEYKAAKERQDALDLLEKGRFEQAFKAFEGMDDEAGMRAAIDAMMENQAYAQAFDACDRLGDEAGMRAAVDAMEAAGDVADTLVHAAKIGDFERANAMFGRLETEDFLLYEESDAGNLKYPAVIATLADMADDEAAAAIAQRYMAKVAEECRGQIDDGRRSIPYYALAQLKSKAEALWTDELQALMESCVEPLPVTGIFRDDGIVREGRGSDIAAITVENKGSANLVFCLNRSLKARVFVFLRPHTRFSFGVVAGGDYWASVSRSRANDDLWFGEQEMFGIHASYDSVVINNGRGRSGTAALIPNPDYTDVYNNEHSLDGGESYYASLQ